MDAGGRRLRLRDAVEARGARCVTEARREPRAHLERALADANRADFLGDREHLEQHRARPVPVAAGDRNHREVEEPDRDALAVAEAAREREDLVVDGVGLAETAFDAIELRARVERRGEVALVAEGARELERLLEVPARGSQVAAAHARHPERLQRRADARLVVRLAGDREALLEARLRLGVASHVEGDLPGVEQRPAARGVAAPRPGTR